MFTPFCKYNKDSQTPVFLFDQNHTGQHVPLWSTHHTACTTYREINTMMFVSATVAACLSSIVQVCLGSFHRHRGSLVLWKPFLDGWRFAHSTYSLPPAMTLLVVVCFRDEVKASQHLHHTHHTQVPIAPQIDCSDISLQNGNACASGARLLQSDEVSQCHGYYLPSAEMIGL